MTMWRVVFGGNSRFSVARRSTSAFGIGGPSVQRSSLTSGRVGTRRPRPVPLGAEPAERGDPVVTVEDDPRAGRDPDRVRDHLRAPHVRDQGVHLPGRLSSCSRRSLSRSNRTVWSRPVRCPGDLVGSLPQLGQCPTDVDGDHPPAVAREEEGVVDGADRPLDLGREGGETCVGQFLPDQRIGHRVEASRVRVGPPDRQAQGAHPPPVERAGGRDPQLGEVVGRTDAELEVRPWWPRLAVGRWTATRSSPGARRVRSDPVPGEAVQVRERDAPTALRSGDLDLRVEDHEARRGEVRRRRWRSTSPSAERHGTGRRPPSDSSRGWSSRGDSG